MYQEAYREFPFTGTIVEEKNRPEKFPFIATNKSISLSVRSSLKYFFAPNSPLIRKSSGEMKKERGNYEALCFSSKRKKLQYSHGTIIRTGITCKKMSL